ncbi:MAG TPA: DNA-binding transcriptional regulator [Planctomicrobium sp.]|nr:DNA-binding transcriptional regulator [Planctomicrobium sp.]
MRKQIQGEPHVAVLIETSRSHGRGLLRGVRQYISEHGPWSVFVELRALESSPPPWLKTWRGDGILTRTSNQRMADLICKVGVPAVELRATRLKLPFPFVGVDNDLLGKMVANHLLDRGFRHFALYDLDTEEYFVQRQQSFLKAVGQAGYQVNVYHAPDQRERPVNWERHQDQLARWVHGLPKPVGILACTDQLGVWLLDACHRAGISVPEEAAIVGVENDESLCTMCSPPMSSVQFDSERMGYKAAALLDMMMAKRPMPEVRPLIPPLGVVVRQSSDIVAIEDREIADAIRFIRHHATEQISVDDVLRAVPLSRSTLERRMRAAIGRSPQSEILRAKLERVKTLLLDTDLTLDAIALKTGLKDAPSLCQRFKRRFGQTPGEFRARVPSPESLD